ncbi:alpha/beta fold hydrolase [Streptomyces sp. NPDC059373]
MISGSGGDAGYYAEVAEALGDAFTVIAYDRRGNSRRSTGESEAPTSVSEQAADVEEVIDRLAGGQALVFGNSAGAIIGLAPAAGHPEALSGLIAHEPPLVQLLPEGDPWRAFFDEMIALARDEGLIPAAVRFGSTIHGEGTYAWPADVRKRFAGNRDRIFRREFPALREPAPRTGTGTTGLRRW